MDERTLTAIGQLDWSGLGLPPADVEQIKSAVMNDDYISAQLARGKSSEVITYQSEIPGTGVYNNRKIQLYTTMSKQGENYILNSKIGYRMVDPNFKLMPDKIYVNLPVHLKTGDVKFENILLDQSKHADIIKALMEENTFTSKTEAGEEVKSTRYVCNICPIPFELQDNAGLHKFFLGVDDRTGRIVAITEESLRNRIVNSEGHPHLSTVLKQKYPLTDKAANTIATGSVSGLLGMDGDGKHMGTAVSFNIARGEIRQDFTKVGRQIRNDLDKYIKETYGEQRKEVQNASQTAKKSTGKKAPKLG